MKLINFGKNITEFIRDPNKNFSERIFLLLTIISDIAVAIALAGDIIFGDNAYEIAVLLGTLIMVPVITFMGLYYNKIDISIRLITLGLIFFVLPAIFFFGGGVEGGGMLWFVFAFMYIGLVVTGNARNVMLFLVGVVSAICFLAEYYHPELVFRKSRGGYPTLISGFLSFWSVVSAVSWCFSRTAYSSRKIALQKNRRRSLRN